MSQTVRVLLIGPPASGKGTQGRLLAEHYGVAYLSSGEMVRAEVAAGTDLGRRVAGLVQAGDLVSDKVMLALLADRLTDAVRAGGYVLDGFPRTLAQAHAAHDLAREADATVSVVIFLDVGHGELVRRMHQRAADEHRADDTEDVLRHRVAVYQQQTAPLLDYYADRGVLVRVDAGQPMGQVTADILAVVEERAFPASDLRASAFGPANGAGGSAARPRQRPLASE